MKTIKKMAKGYVQANSVSELKAFSKNWYVKKIKPNHILYIFLIPILVYAVIFWYAPMVGIIMSFQRYSPGLGMFKSPWVGFFHFQKFFESYMFWRLIKNTLVLSLYGFIAGMPIPIILAITFKYCESKRFVKVIQTAVYGPFFISTVVAVAMIMIFLSPRTGLINVIIESLGGNTISFMAKSEYFRHIYVWSDIWQGAGWGSIIYTAALAGSNPELHEAAIIDGASKIKRVFYIDLPVLAPTFIILQIFSVGNIMGIGYEKVFLMQNSANSMVSEIISTYQYTMGIRNGEFSYTTAIGLFNNLINFILLISANALSKKFTNRSVI